MSEEKKQEAIEIFGAAKVNEVIDIVETTDPDGAYTTFQDFEDEDAAEIVEMLYFNLED